MINKLRKKFIIITMSLVSGLTLFLFTLSNYYDNYWNDFDTYRIVKVVAENGYITDSSSEAIALVTIDEKDQAIIDGNYTNLSNKEVVSISRSLLKSGKKSWKWRDYIYQLIEKSDGSWQVVFIDQSSYGNSLVQNLLIFIFIVFGFCLLLGVSFYLSRFIIQPAQKALDREKQFVSDASHELKTPIAAIRANAQVLQNQIEPSRYLEHILTETKRMEDLVQKLLGLSRLDEGQDIKMTRLNFSSICEEMLLSYESLAYEDAKLIDANISENIYVQGDEGQLKQLLAILLDNSLKYSLDKSTISLDLFTNKNHAVLRVSNPSPKYSQEVLEKFFERFYQAESSRSRQDSFGLGLAIAKAIVEKHKGTIQVMQKQDKITFEITLPAKH